MKAKRHEHLRRKPKKDAPPAIGQRNTKRPHENGRPRNEGHNRTRKPINLAEVNEIIFPQFVFFRGELYPTYWVFTYKGADEPAEGEIVGHTPSLGSAPPQTLTWENGGVVARSKNR